MTCPKREAGEAIRERPGIVYPLLPHAQRPDTSVTPSPAAHCCGHWKHQPAPASAINQETRFSKTVAQTPSQSFDGSVPTAQALGTPRTLV